MTYIDHYTSPLGPMTMASDGDHLIGLWFDGQKYDRANINKVEAVERDLPIFDQTKSWLDTYFSGEVPTFTPALKFSGSPFRQRVGELLLTIPYGETRTYGDLAKIIVQEQSPLPQQGGLGRVPQAVGGAVGHNPISIIIPCHRVLGSPSSPKQGSCPPITGEPKGVKRPLSQRGPLTGYAGGLDRKLWLLTHEQNHGDSITVPGTAVEESPRF